MLKDLAIHNINKKMYNNIIDQSVPEIKVPILKPIKAKNVPNQGIIKKIVNNTQEQLNKFADWIISYVPQEVKKPFNKRVEDLKNTVNNIYNSIKKETGNEQTSIRESENVFDKGFIPENPQYKKKDIFEKFKKNNENDEWIIQKKNELKKDKEIINLNKNTSEFPTIQASLGDFRHS